MDQDYIGQYRTPTATQLKSFTSFNVNVAADTDFGVSTFKNRIGVYTAETEEQGSYNILWIEYVPKFGEEEESWCVHATPELNETWRLLFQMGDNFSDWEGVEYTFTAGEPIK